jgi:hypothetical protein
MKHKNSFLKPVVFYFFIALLCIACKKDNDDTMTMKTGDWAGTDISFAVGGNPLKISDLEFTYSGHAIGTNCDYNYESGASFATVAEIKGLVFSATLNTFVLEGEFLNDTTAEITIDWTGYDTNCDANYSGSRTYTAFYN